jgi:hypothetical protein
MVVPSGAGTFQAESCGAYFDADEVKHLAAFLAKKKVRWEF